MIECIFTIDYEIYGNGEGSLRELVYEPTRQLKSIFDQSGAKCVFFVEASELEMIEKSGTDPVVHDVRKQVEELYQDGHEIALHLHPQWYNARYENGRWVLDYDEYNLCLLPEKRIAEIVDRSIAYLRTVLGDPDYRPTSFRAGNWLFQPTMPAAKVLSERGIKIDSSVFKGGVQHQYGLDYRPSIKNGDFWKFKDDVNEPDPNGPILEFPIYTKRVPFWKMITGKRLGLQRQSSSGAQTSAQKRNRLRDRARFWYPLKFDFCRMTMSELTGTVDAVLRADRKDPASLRPLVAIGHTKDLVDFRTVERFLSYLDEKGIPVTTLNEISEKCEP
jgi:peptidoglycan/xylan/chitin deacetylase (PgdA/CDA1 family)